MQRILITGSNRGIGLEMVRQYLRRDDTCIFATCRRPDEADELRKIANDRVTILELDVAHLDDIQRVATQVHSQVNGLDILINNAAINPKGIQSFDAINAETMMTVFQVNAVAPLMLVKALVDLLRNGNNPRIVNISSQVGSMEWKSSGGSYAYSTSKAALNMITRSLAGDLGRQGIKVITLHPGWVQTDMGGHGAPLTTEESAQGVLHVVDHLTATDNGKFFKWNGQIHAW
jgi:NAD(P)-dependent dehydrogenase (short-subunit alcohol dehydrogenase family)